MNCFFNDRDRIIRGATVNTAAAIITTQSETPLAPNDFFLGSNQDGDAILEPLREVIRANILPKVEVNLSCFPFDQDGHTLGAAFLVLTDYFLDIPAQLDQRL